MGRGMAAAPKRTRGCSGCVAPLSFQLQSRAIALARLSGTIGASGRHGIVRPAIRLRLRRLTQSSRRAFANQETDRRIPSRLEADPPLGNQRIRNPMQTTPSPTNTTEAGALSPRASENAAACCGCGEADRRMLEGPRSRTRELITLLRVTRDFVRGFRVLHFVGPCVTVFGSARTREDDPNYQLARQMGAAIARLGFTVMTG